MELEILKKEEERLKLESFKIQSMQEKLSIQMKKK